MVLRGWGFLLVWEERKAFDGWVFSLADCGKQESRTFDRVNTII